ncbi:RadC family protein [Lacticaseibacillus nasuensis]|uniref:DNA repair protein RadC n=2 Tax=Lacticaseibacillus TaxID=2759736 RepID=A0A0R1K1F0_9LACO|nr:DNA repair protein RadC [Lacticaseibacillus nasuensis]KRK73223.1 DNA repair protein RadC [Lacticaseibacillus nasuensis JCM 17158]
MAQPRELLRDHGAKTLTDAELLMVVLGSGSQVASLAEVAGGITAAYPGLAGLATAPVRDLMQVRGLGLAKAASVSAAAEIGRRVLERQSLRVGDYADLPELAEHLMVRFSGVTQEVIIVIFLDTQNRVIQETEVARGGMDSAVVDPRVVFRQGLLVNAAQLILAHNHPSGVTVPSEADIAVTERFIGAGQLMGMALADHLIIGAHNYYAFSEHPDALSLS